MYLVGLTGGIASGKSTVITMMKDIGIEVIDADVIAKEIVLPGKPAWIKIKRAFGDAILLENGRINRPLLAAIIFSDRDKRLLLNKITHPEVYKQILIRCVKMFFTCHQFAVIDLPLLYESGYMVKFLSKIIVVKCSEEQQLQRLMTRNRLTNEEAVSRISAQMPIEEKARLADYVIDNSGHISDTRKQTEEIVSKLKSSYTHLKIRIIFILTFIVTGGSLGYLIKKIILSKLFH